MVGFRNHENFSFPEPVAMKLTMSDIWQGNCSRDIGFTLRVGGRGSKIHDRRNWDSYEVDGEVKQLTPLEGLKMQGLPSDYNFPVSETQAMKQLGNSVAVPVVEAIAEKLVESLK